MTTRAECKGHFTATDVSRVSSSAVDWLCPSCVCMTTALIRLIRFLFQKLDDSASSKRLHHSFVDDLMDGVMRCCLYMRCI